MRQMSSASSPPESLSRPPATEQSEPAELDVSYQKLASSKNVNVLFPLTHQCLWYICKSGVILFYVHSSAIIKPTRKIPDIP